MANIRNERKDKTAAGLLSMRVDEVTDNIGQDGMAVMTERLDLVEPLVAELEKRLEAAPAEPEAVREGRDHLLAPAQGSGQEAALGRDHP